MIIIEVYKLENKLTLPFTIKIMKRMILLHREFLTTKSLLDNIKKKQIQRSDCELSVRVKNSDSLIFCIENIKKKRFSIIFAKKQIKRRERELTVRVKNSASLIFCIEYFSNKTTSR
jgi:hypothetical protein